MALRQDVPLSVLLLVILPIMFVFIAADHAAGHAAVPRRCRSKVDRINQVMREALAGVRVIRAFVRVEHEEQRFDDANHDLIDTALRVNRLFALTFPTMMLHLQPVVGRDDVVRRASGRQRRHADRQPDGVPRLPHADPVLGPDGRDHVRDGARVPRRPAERIQEVLDTEPTVTDPDAAGRDRRSRARLGRVPTTSSSATRAPRSRSCAASRSRPSRARRPPSSAAPAAASRR